MKRQVNTKGKQDPVLEVKDLSIAYETKEGDVLAVRGLSFKAYRGETIGFVGESGCGKSTIAFGVVDFLGPNGKIVGGSVKFQGRSLLGCTQELRQLWGNRIAMVYQDPMQALNPSLHIGVHLAEVLVYHQQMPNEEAWDRSIDMLKRVYMPDPTNVMDRYPHQLSGGQQQRVVIAMSLLNNPTLLIMDEPTTALDVTVEAAVLEPIEDLRKDFDTSILFITHNLGVIPRVCDYVLVMYAGEIVEEGLFIDIYNNPQHPYTQGLLRSIPNLGSSKTSSTLYPIRGSVPPPGEIPQHPCLYASRCDYASDKCRSERPDLWEIEAEHRARCFYGGELKRRTWIPPTDNSGKLLPREAFEPSDSYVLKICNLKAYYQEESKSVMDLLGLAKKRYVKAVDGVTFGVQECKIFGIVGESGSGKSTLAKAIVGFEKIKDGKAEFLGFDISMPLQKRNLKLIREMQMVYQNPDSTLNPSYSVGKQISRPLKRFKIVPRKQIRDRAIELLKAVHLAEYYYNRLPRQLSGGEKQRVGIARALASRPDLVICDEPVSALDVSVRANLLNLLMDVQEEFGTTIVFIAHDLSVVRFISDYVAVMYLGQIVEIGHTEAIYDPPYHPYTEALLSAVPILDPHVEHKHIRLEGDVPSALNLPNGCRFHTRCPRRTMLPEGGKICEIKEPSRRETGNGHFISCHIPIDELSKIGRVSG